MSSTTGTLNFTSAMFAGMTRARSPSSLSASGSPSWATFTETVSAWVVSVRLRVNSTLGESASFTLAALAARLTGGPPSSSSSCTVAALPGAAAMV